MRMASRIASSHWRATLGCPTAGARYSSTTISAKAHARPIDEWRFAVGSKIVIGNGISKRNPAIRAQRVWGALAAMTAADSEGPNGGGADAKAAPRSAARPSARIVA